MLWEIFNRENGNSEKPFDTKRKANSYIGGTESAYCTENEARFPKALAVYIDENAIEIHFRGLEAGHWSLVQDKDKKSWNEGQRNLYGKRKQSAWFRLADRCRIRGDTRKRSFGIEYKKVDIPARRFSAAGRENGNTKENQALRWLRWRSLDFFTKMCRTSWERGNSDCGSMSRRIHIISMLIFSDNSSEAVATLSELYLFAGI